MKIYRQAKKKLSRRERTEERAFFMFISPFLLGLLIFGVFPIAFSGVLCFMRWDFIRPSKLVGLENFRKMFQDELFWQSLKVTGLYTVFSVPLGLISGFLVALLLNQKIRGMRILRTIYYLPVVVGGVPASILWVYLFNPEFGLLNTLLRSVGINGPLWLASATWVIPSLVLMSLWSVGGSMVIYLAGLQGIPVSLYEAAEIDGASVWRKFVHITVPLMTPIIFFNLMMGIIGSFQVFTQAFIMTNGGPANASLFYGLYLYRTAFLFFKMGYGSALAWILFFIILSCALVILRSARYWVYYAGGFLGGR